MREREREGEHMRDREVKGCVGEGGSACETEGERERKEGNENMNNIFYAWDS